MHFLGRTSDPGPDGRLIEAQFGPLRSFTMANSNYPNHTVLAREMQAYLRWRNANARHPDGLAAQRRDAPAANANNAGADHGRGQPDPRHGERSWSALTSGVRVLNSHLINTMIVTMTQ